MKDHNFRCSSINSSKNTRDSGSKKSKHDSKSFSLFSSIFGISVLADNSRICFFILSIVIPRFKILQFRNGSLRSKDFFVDTTERSLFWILSQHTRNLKFCRFENRMCFTGKIKESFFSHMQNFGMPVFSCRLDYCCHIVYHLQFRGFARFFNDSKISIRL